MNAQLELPLFSEIVEFRPARLNGEEVPGKYVVRVETRTPAEVLERKLTTAEAARLMKVDRRTVNRLIADGTLTRIPAGKRRHKVPLSSVQRWIESGTRHGDF